MDAGFTVGAYSVRRGNGKDGASITLTDRKRVWKARLEFVPVADDEERPGVELEDDHCGRVLMAADALDVFIDLLHTGAPLYVAFSTDTDMFLVTAKDEEAEAEAA